MKRFARTCALYVHWLADADKSGQAVHSAQQIPPKAIV